MILVYLPCGKKVMELRIAVIIFLRKIFEHQESLRSKLGLRQSLKAKQSLPLSRVWFTGKADF